jgi:hypothetical protein
MEAFAMLAGEQHSDCAGDWSVQYNAARAVAAEVFANYGLRSEFLALRDDLDADFVDLITRMASLWETA